MATVRSRAITSLTAAAALALGVIPAAFTASSILASGEDATTIAPATDIFSDPPPDLVIRTGADDRVFVDDDGDRKWTPAADGVPAEPNQTLTGQSRDCRLVTDGSLLGFSGNYAGLRSGAPDPASFASDSLGVAEKKTGTSCYQVNAASSDVLTLSLGPDLVGSYEIDAATLDVELKQNAVIFATAYLDADGDGPEVAEIVKTFELQSGGSRSLLSNDRADETYECQGSSDSGPDSGPSDNCAWPIDVVGGSTFNVLQLKATVGSFSLEGGSDSPALAPSVFNLAWGTFACNTNRSLDGSSDGTTPAVTATRLNNADGSPCAPVRYRFTNGTQSAELLKPLDAEETAQFVYEFVWTVAADVVAENPVNGIIPDSSLVKRTTVDFDSEGPGDQPTAIASCPNLIESPVLRPDGTPFLVVDGVEANDVDSPDQAPGYPGSGDADTKQFACIVSQSVEPVLGTNNVQIREEIYAYGDIALRK